MNNINLHAKVNKYIILHDTTTFGYQNEVLYEHASDKVKSEVVIKEGLKAAIDDFLLTEDGKSWFVYREYTNNNGLTILKRK